MALSNRRSRHLSSRGRFTTASRTLNRAHPRNLEQPTQVERALRLRVWSRLRGGGGRPTHPWRAAGVARAARHRSSVGRRDEVESARGQSAGHAQRRARERERRSHGTNRADQSQALESQALTHQFVRSQEVEAPPPFLLGPGLYPRYRSSLRRSSLGDSHPSPRCRGYASVG